MAMDPKGKPQQSTPAKPAAAGTKPAPTTKPGGAPPQNPGKR